MAVIQKLDQYIFNAHNPRNTIGIKNIHVHRKTAFQIGVFKQMFHQKTGVDRTVFGFKNNTDVMGRFIADIAEHRQLFVHQQLGYFLNQFGFDDL